MLDLFCGGGLSGSDGGDRNVVAFDRPCFGWLVYSVTPRMYLSTEQSSAVL